MLTLDSNLTMEGLDLAVSDEILLTRTSRTATFTLGSSSCSSEEFIENSKCEHRVLTHSQSLTIDCQRRRPIIEDPYRVSPNLQLLDDWMIVSRQ